MRPWRPLAVLGLTLLAAGCVQLPDVYVIDRHTVMEQEAAGEWPSLETRFQGVQPGPEPLPQASGAERQARAFAILNGEFPMETTAQSDDAAEMTGPQASTEPAAP